MKVFWFNVNHISFMLTICGNTVEMARENNSIRWKNMSILKLTYTFEQVVNKLNFTVINCLRYLKRWNPEATCISEWPRNNLHHPEFITLCWTVIWILGDRGHFEIIPMSRLLQILSLPMKLFYVVSCFNKTIID